MNPKTLRPSIAEPDQFEMVYADSYVGGTASVQVSPNSGGRLTVIRPGFATLSNQVAISSDSSAAAGRKLTIIPTNASANRSGEYGIGSVTVSSVAASGLQFGGRAKLATVDISGVLIKRLNLSNSPLLSTVSIVNCARLEQISLAGCKAISYLNLQTLPALAQVNLNSAIKSSITYVVLNGLDSLRNFNFAGMTSLANFGALSCPLLEAIDISDSSVSACAPQNLPALKSIKFPATLSSVTLSAVAALQTIDASLCASLSYLDAQGSAALASVAIPSGWAGGNGKARLYLQNCNLGSTALVTLLNNLGTFAGYKNYIDISGNPGSNDGGVAAAATSAAERGWYIYTGVV